MNKVVILLLVCLLVLSGCSGQSSGLDESTKMVNVGIVQYTEHIALDRAREGFLAGLKDLGYKVNADEVNIQQDMTLIPSTASKFQADKVDLVYALSTPVAQGMKASITDTPIIFNAVTDPISAELLGDNITGVSNYFPLKRQMELFLEEFPDVKTLGVLYSIGEANSEVLIKELRQVCQELGLNLEEVAVNSTNDVSQAMTSLISKIDGFVMITDNLAASAAPVIANSLKEAKIPSFAGEPGPVESGILISDGIDYIELGRQAAKMADQIIQGSKPSDIEVFYMKEASRFVNKTTADSLGISEDSSIYEGARIIK